MKTTREEAEDNYDPPVHVCNNCGEQCKPVEDVIDYAGTHCTNGLSGTFHTGEWYSDCCNTDYKTEE